MSLKEEVAAGYRPYYNPNSKQVQRFRAAMDFLHENGIQPTGRLVIDLIGGTWGMFGLGGRDGTTFTIHMEELGYVKYHGRWREP